MTTSLQGFLEESLGCNCVPLSSAENQSRSWRRWNLRHDTGTASSHPDKVGSEEARKTYGHASLRPSLSRVEDWRRMLLRLRLSVTVSAGIKQQHFRRFCSQHQQTWVGGSGRPGLARTSFSSSSAMAYCERARHTFLLTQIQTWLTIEGGRRSGGVCWRATPRNTRLDSSRTMGGRWPCRRPKEAHRTDRSRCLYSKPVSKLFGNTRDCGRSRRRRRGLDQDACALRRPVHSAGPNVCPRAGRATKSVTQDFGSDAAPSLLMPKPNAREDSYLY